MLIYLFIAMGRAVLFSNFSSILCYIFIYTCHWSSHRIMIESLLNDILRKQNNPSLVEMIFPGCVYFSLLDFEEVTHVSYDDTSGVGPGIREGTDPRLHYNYY